MAYRVDSETIIENKSKVTIYCDAKTDVTNNMKIGGRDLVPFSKAITKTLDVGIYGSDGTWTWN